MRPEELKQTQSQIDQADIKIRAVTNGYVLRVRYETFVYYKLDDVFIKIREFFEKEAAEKKVKPNL